MLCLTISLIQGDSILNQALSEIGGKGLFTKELDNALLDKTVSCYCLQLPMGIYSFFVFDRLIYVFIQ